MTTDDDETVARLIADGYVPVVTNRHINDAYNQRMDGVSEQQLAALLGKDSVNLVSCLKPVLPGLKRSP